MRMDLVIRFGYGSIVPWVRAADGLSCAVAGPDALSLWTPVDTRGEDMTTVAEFTVSATEHMSLRPHLVSLPRGCRRAPSTPATPSTTPRAGGRTGPSLSTFEGPVARRRDALAHHPEGAHLPAHGRDRRRGDDVAARDPRRRAQLGLPVLLAARRHAHARRRSCGAATTKRPWPGATGCCGPWPATPPSCRSCTGRRRAAPRRMGGRLAARLRGLAPVRVGNAASGQFQLDVYGEVHLGAARVSATGGHAADRAAWDLEQGAGRLRRRRAGSEPDDGHLGGARARGGTSPTPRSWPGWRWTGPCGRSRTSASRAPSIGGGELRDGSTPRCCDKGYNADVGAFTQYYGSDELDASVLMIPLGGVPPRHRRPRALAPSRPSRRSSPRTASCCATAPPTPGPSTGSPGTRARSWRARSGWPTACT